MESVQETITLPVDSSQLVHLREMVRGFCTEHAIDRRITYRLVLAIDEHVANIIEHSTDADQIRVSFDLRGKELVAEIEASGSAFDPCEFVKNNSERPERAKRGYGLFLIHLVTNEVKYQRSQQGTNVLTLIMDLSRLPFAPEAAVGSIPSGATTSNQRTQTEEKP